MALLRAKTELSLDGVNIGRICLPFIDISFIQGLEVGVTLTKIKVIIIESLGD